MSTTASALTVAAVLVVSLPVAWWQVRRARRHEAIRNQLARLNPGPVEQQAAVLLNAYLLDNPYLADGFARLDQTIRERSEQGDQP